jgi:hypothetical protein
LVCLLVLTLFDFVFLLVTGLRPCSVCLLGLFGASIPVAAVGLFVPQGSALALILYCNFLGLLRKVLNKMCARQQEAIGLILIVVISLVALACIKLCFRYDS